MKKTKLFLKMVVLAMVSALMSGCAEEIDALLSANQSIIQKTTISLADDTSTRGAIAADGKTSFSVNDQIAVIYQNTSGKTVKAVSAALTGTDLTDGGASATFTVELKSPKAGTKVRYIYPASMVADDVSTTTPDNDLTINTAGLAKQDGTLATLANDYGLAVYDGTMSTSATLPTGTDVILKNQLAILKLQSIKIDASTEIRSQITDLTVTDGINTYTITRTAEDGPIFVAMLPTTGDITISTTVGGISYTKTATAETLESNKIYPVNLSLDLDAVNTPLTLEVTVANTTIRCRNQSHVPFTYTVNSVATSFDINNPSNDIYIHDLQVGDIVQFFSTNASLCDGINDGLSIKPDQMCYVYGNVMSLIDDGTEGFANDKTIGGTSAFQKLFIDSNIAFHPSKRLVLPATTLSAYCYYGMFENCDGITSLPADLLPAINMAPYCYNEMFYGCDGLTSLPEDLLPTGKNGEGLLADWCYGGMFRGCKGLTSLPEKLLPAMTLKDYCYWDLFGNCDGLTTLPEKFLPATTLAEDCYMSMFANCDLLTESPVLPDATLADKCYELMLGNCPKLSKVTCLVKSTSLGSADNPFKEWLISSGTEDGCERIVYIDPSMLNPATDIWNLALAGNDNSPWVLAAANRYPLAAANAEAIDLGKVIASDGNIYPNKAAATAAGKTAVAMIAYVGPATGEEAYNFTHGLALALSDTNSYYWGNWDSSSSTVHTYTTTRSSFASESGLQYNSYDPDHNSDTYPAFKAAMANNGTVAPTGCSAWFLPTGYQWNQMINACKNVLGTKNSYEDLRDGFNSVGGTNLQSLAYWSSTEYNYSGAWYYVFFNGTWESNDKEEPNIIIRSALAF